jgi:hypothetical protein
MSSPVPLKKRSLLKDLPDHRAELPRVRTDYDGLAFGPFLSGKNRSAGKPVRLWHEGWANDREGDPALGGG